MAYSDPTSQREIAEDIARNRANRRRVKGGSPQAVLHRFETAVRDHAFIGAAHPEDVPEIAREYDEAKSAITAMLLKVK